MISALEQEFALDRSSTVSLPEQIVRAVRSLIAEGLLRPDEPLPSSRRLASALEVSRGSVVTAFDQLLAEGLLISKPRSGLRVAPQGAAVPHDPKRSDAPAASSFTDMKTVPLTASHASESSTARPLHLDLTPGRERHQPLNDTLWRRAWREAVNPPTGAERTVDAAGSAQLREAITQHLRLVRAMDPDPAHMIVTSGARDGLALTLRALRNRLGRDVTVAVERPGFPGLRRALAGSGASIVHLLADEVGPLPRCATDQQPDLVLLTPNHQFPDGSPLLATRRTQLLEWAATLGAYVIEDDYDSEFRHLGPPLPALWSLDAERVIHLGTFTSVLGRDIGTGYVLVPLDLVAEFNSARTELGMNVPPIVQRALAHYLSEGGLQRRIARGRRRLVRTQLRAQEELAAISSTHALAGSATLAPGRDVQWLNTGHLIILRTGEVGALNIQTRCRAVGLGVGLLSDGWAGAPDQHGVVLSYGACDADELSSALSILCRQLEYLRLS